MDAVSAGLLPVLDVEERGEADRRSTQGRQSLRFTAPASFPACAGAPARGCPDAGHSLAGGSVVQSYRITPLR